MQKINTINFKINNVMLNNSKFFSYFKDTINTTLTLLISSGKNSTWKNEGAEFTRFVRLSVIHFAIEHRKM